MSEFTADPCRIYDQLQEMDQEQERAESVAYYRKHIILERDQAELARENLVRTVMEFQP